jgi:hypothetical protein
MAHYEDWLPSREQDLADLCKKWKAELEDPATVSAFGWNQADCTVTAPKIGAFLIALDAYGEEDSSKNRLTKKQGTKAKGNRVIKRNKGWLWLKRKEGKVLAEHDGLMKCRSVEVKTVCGHLKGNQGYRGFQLRGMEKVSTEWGLRALGYHMNQGYRMDLPPLGRPC